MQAAYNQMMMFHLLIFAMFCELLQLVQKKVNNLRSREFKHQQILFLQIYLLLILFQHLLVISCRNWTIIKIKSYLNLVQMTIPYQSSGALPALKYIQIFIIKASFQDLYQQLLSRKWYCIPSILSPDLVKSFLADSKAVLGNCFLLVIQQSSQGM